MVLGSSSSCLSILGLHWLEAHVGRLIRQSLDGHKSRLKFDQVPYGAALLSLKSDSVDLSKQGKSVPLLQPTPGSFSRLDGTERDRRDADGSRRRGVTGCFRCSRSDLILT